MSPNPGRILVIRGGAIGDFILTLPVLSALRRQFPGAHIEVLGYPRIASLAKAAGLADEVRAIEGREFAMLFARGVKPASDIAGYFARFTLVVSYLFDPDGIFEENVTGCGCTQYLAGPHRPNEGERLHATDVLLKPLERLAVFDADPTPVLNVAPAGTANAITVALHPGSGSEHKNWPESNWRWLVELILRETSWNLLLVAGEAEGDRLKRVAPQPDAHTRALVAGGVDAFLNPDQMRELDANGIAIHDDGPNFARRQLNLADAHD